MSVAAGRLVDISNSILFFLHIHIFLQNYNPVCTSSCVPYIKPLK